MGRLPEFLVKYGADFNVIERVSLPSDGAYAFVLFADDVLARTAISLDGMQLQGRPLKIGRSEAFRQQWSGCLLPEPLDVSPLHASGLVPVAVRSAEADEARRMREVYFGGLVVGWVTADNLRDLVAPICEQLPSYQPPAACGRPVVRVDLHDCGKYAFVELQDVEMVEEVIAIFDGVQFFGRKLHVNK